VKSCFGGRYTFGAEYTSTSSRYSLDKVRARTCDVQDFLVEFRSFLIYCFRRANRTHIRLSNLRPTLRSVATAIVE
ncbi:hypothetical protein L9F63_002742, partial [Diploptera punctata]